MGRARGRAWQLGVSVPIFKMGRKTHVPLCLGYKRERLENVLPKCPGSPRSLWSLQLLRLSWRSFWKMQGWNRE